MSPRRSGMTLIEAAVSIAIVGIVLTSAVAVHDTSTRAYRTESHRTQLTRNAQVAFGKLRGLLTYADADSITGLSETPGFYDDELTFDLVTISQASGTETLEETRVEFRLAPGESDDDTDENDNGLVDEGRVVLTLNVGAADEMEVVLADSVREYLEGETADGTDENGNGLIDEPGLCFERRGSVVKIWLTLEGVDRFGIRTVQTLQTACRLRN